MPAEPGLDLAKLDPIAADLDLMVGPAEKLDHSIGPEAGQIASAVHPSAGGAESLPGFVPGRFVGDASLTATALLRITVLKPHWFTQLEIGVQGVGSVGRVWYDPEPSTRWHDGFGGGLWLRIPSLDRGIGFNAVKGDEDIRFYLDFFRCLLIGIVASPLDPELPFEFVHASAKNLITGTTVSAPNP